MLSPSNTGLATTVDRPQYSLSDPRTKRKDRILLVDDSRVVRKVFSTYLSSKFDCFEAASFEEAVRALRKFEFAVVVTDIIIPGMSGIELLRRVVKDFPNTEIIVASRIDRPQRALDAIRLGAFDYLIKPCEPTVLEVTVERAIERRNLLLDANRYKLELEKRNTELLERKSELERLQVQIVQSSKMASLGQLAAGVAHELNNPVGFVHANLEILDSLIQDLVRLVQFYEKSELSASAACEADLLKESIRFPVILDDINSIVADCREGSDRIRGISQNLRTFSRLDEAEYKDTDIHEGIEATVRLASQHFNSGKIVVTRDFHELPPLAAYSGQLNQVWMNLIVNAAQAIGSDAGEIRISTRFDEDNVWVEFSDNGCGIAIQHLNRIFDPFFTTKSVGEGTGLGLSISFSIVERHGGNISVVSGLGKGTTFKVRLPRNFVPDEESLERSIEVHDGDHGEI